MSEGNRVHERHACELPVAIVHDGQTHHGVTVNVSLGGLFLTAPEDLPFGASVQLQFQLPAMKEPSAIDGTVRWVRDGGIGVQFGRLRAIEVWAINQLFKSSQ